MSFVGLSTNFVSLSTNFVSLKQTLLVYQQTMLVYQQTLLVYQQTLLVYQQVESEPPLQSGFSFSLIRVAPPPQHYCSTYCTLCSNIEIETLFQML